MAGDFGNQDNNTVHMADLEAQRTASTLHNDNEPVVDPGPSRMRELTNHYVKHASGSSYADFSESRTEYYRCLSPSPIGYESLIRIIVPLGGALFVLVPMYIMATQQSLTTNLITTTIAVMLLVLVFSLFGVLPKSQIFVATVGYASVLTVFVGLTSSPQ
jgi:VIT1/CCC1 family predicted Fe2+/Mn2+ transporter